MEPKLERKIAAPLVGAVAALRARVAHRALGAVRSRKRELLLEIAGVPTGAAETTTSAVHWTAERRTP